MPTVSEKKLKLLYVAQILLEQTDDQHAVTLPQMMEQLEARGVRAERKSLYDDLETLRHFGFPIETRKTRSFEYYLGKRRFSEAELSLLAHVVETAPGLSQRKVQQLLQKIASLGSQYQSQALLDGKSSLLEEEQESSTGKTQPPSSEILLRLAMERDVQVVFELVGWEASSGKGIRQVTRTVTASPWRVFRQDGVTCLLAYVREEKKPMVLPVEALSRLQLLTQPREGEGMLPNLEKLTLEFPQGQLEAVALHFAGALSLETVGKGRLRAVVKAPVDEALFAWLFTAGSGVQLIAPKKAAGQFRERAKSLAKAYKT